MRTAEVWGQRSTCPKSNAAAVVSKGGRILSIGYIGSPPGQKHCFDVGCLIEETTGSCIRGIHSETNAISFAARKGINIEDSEMYVTLSPCLRCAQMIVASGITAVIYLKEHWDKRGLSYLEDNGVFVASISEILDKGGDV